MAKSNSKSVRLSDEVLQYIEGYEGSGFNEKFENIILFAMRTEKDRQQRIMSLDNDIKRRHDDYLLIDRKLRDLNWRVREVLDLDKKLDAIKNSLDLLV